MNPSVKSLLDGIIDYAGLFPPAALPMGEAFERYLEHRQTDQSWMLARFVCPAARLKELEPLLKSSQNGSPPLALAVLGRGGDTLDDFLESMKHDVSLVREFTARNSGLVAADVFEVKLPAAGGAAVAVNDASIMLTKPGTDPITPFFESNLLGEWRQLLPAAAAAVRDADRKTRDRSRVGLKIRCGGLDATAVPEPIAVAATIAMSRTTGIPLKATQGLHHPFRHHDPELDTMVHGFLNLFVASVLASAHDLPVTLLTELIAETDPGAFEFSDDQVGWRDFRASADEVVSARRLLLTSFGSCSFSEPCGDLRALNLVD